MTVRIMLAALALSVPSTLLAQASLPQPPAAAEDLVRVALDTDKGRIVLALDLGRAPITTANFLAYVDKKLFAGETFYRAFKYGDGGVVQGGARSAGKQLPTIAHEPTSKPGLSNKAWTIAMANAGAGTAGSDFFIMTTDIPAFDAKGSDIGFAAFGKVIEGQDVVKAILASPVSPTRGEGSMRGQMLDPAVKIMKAERVED